MGLQVFRGVEILNRQSNRGGEGTRDDDQSYQDQSKWKEIKEEVLEEIDHQYLFLFRL